ncbi:MAG: protein kinase, partial [Myxococcota bacterium]
LIHRDIKPENILFRSDNSAVLGDFGTAILEDDDRLLQTRAAGTMAYMAPELKQPIGDTRPTAVSICTA